MRIKRATIWATFCMVAMGVPTAEAQQQEPEQQPQQQEAQPQRPIPAYRSPLASAADNGDEDDSNANPQKLIPDDRSLAGAQVLSLGELSGIHNYWQPHVDVNVTADSDGLSQTNTTGWTSWSSVFGGVDLHHISGTSNLSLLYSGGVSISNDGSSNNEVIQSLQFIEKLTFRRTSLSIADQLSYLPEAAFGFQGAGGGNIAGGGGIGLQSSFQPGQSILTAQGQRLSNTFVPELDVHLSPRSTLTFVGTYSLLHFFDNDLLNYQEGGFQAGYNYQMTRKDTIGFLYHFTAFRYTGFNQSINDNVVQLTYGRRITGKLAFQISAGPEFTSFQTPIMGPGSTGTGGTGTATPPSAGTSLYWSLNSSLRYQMRRTGLGMTYVHGVSGGSGVQAGSVADTVTGSMSRQLSRTFSGAWSLGYARNNGLTVGTPTSATATQNQTYGYWTANANLSHSMGRTMNMSLIYTLQYQSSNGAFCVGPTCQTSLTRHQVSLSFGWHDRPIPF
ncbi:MAG: hypothetical protein WB780_20240 [Candidatus Acidiferrales bacterium]